MVWKKQCSLYFLWKTLSFIYYVLLFIIYYFISAFLLHILFHFIIFLNFLSLSFVLC